MNSPTLQKLHIKKSSSEPLLNMTNQNTILAELECPSCREYMVEEIVICQNGHSTCKKCKDSTETSCKICQQPFVVERNHTLEKVVAAFKYPCKNPGCGKLLEAKNIFEHERFCEFGVYECALYFTGCNWSGKLSELIKHVKNKHKEHTKAFINTNNVKSIVHFHKDEVFIVFNKHTDYAVTYSATYNGLKKNAKDFKVKVVFEDESDKGYELGVVMPCIPRCKVEDVFNSDKFILSKINSTLQETFLKNGKYTVTTTIIEN